MIDVMMYSNDYATAKGSKMDKLVRHFDRFFYACCKDNLLHRRYCLLSDDVTDKDLRGRNISLANLSFAM